MRESQPAVSKARVGFQLIQGIELDPEAVEHPAGILGQVEVIQGVFQRPAHQKFHAQVIHLLALLFMGLPDGLHPLAAHPVPQDQDQGVVKMLVGRAFGLDGKIVEQFGRQSVPQFLLGRRVDGGWGICFCHIAFPFSRTVGPSRKAADPVTIIYNVGQNRNSSLYRLKTFPDLPRKGDLIINHAQKTCDF